MVERKKKDLRALPPMGSYYTFEILLQIINNIRFHGWEKCTLVLHIITQLLIEFQLKNTVHARKIESLEYQII